MGGIGGEGGGVGGKMGSFAGSLLPTLPAAAGLGEVDGAVARFSPLEDSLPLAVPALVEPDFGVLLFFEDDFGAGVVVFPPADFSSGLLILAAAAAGLLQATKNYCCWFDQTKGKVVN